MQHALFFLAMLTGGLALYAVRIRSRSTVFDLDPAPLKILGAIGTVAFFSLIVWGFLNLTWWHVILTFVVVSAILVPALFHSSYTRNIVLALEPMNFLICIATVLAILFIY